MLALAMLLIVSSWIGIVPPLPRIFRSTPSQKRRPASVTTNEGRPILVMIVPWRIPIPAQARSAAGDRRPPRPPVSRAREVGHDHAAEAGDEPDREVDLPEQQDEDLAHREQAEDRSLDEQVDEVAGGQELRVEGLEEDGDQDQSRDDRQDPALAGLDPGERGSEVLADGIGGDLGRNRELGLASRLLCLNVRFGRRDVSSTLAIRRRLRSWRAAPTCPSSSGRPRSGGRAPTPDAARPRDRGRAR